MDRRRIAARLYSRIKTVTPEERAHKRLHTREYSQKNRDQRINSSPSEDNNEIETIQTLQLVLLVSLS